MRFSLSFFSALISTCLISSAALGATGLVIHAAEYGVGKFHRYDNKVHPYATTNAWYPYILPDDAKPDLDNSQPMAVKNADGSVTIFYSTLDDLVNATVQVAKQLKGTISVLNVHAHGEPGGMGFPATNDDLTSAQCKRWRDLAYGDDKADYDKYYDAVSWEEAQSVELMSQQPISDPSEGCVTGLPEWKNEVTADFKALFTKDTQIHFLSCSVGLGEAGKEFTEGIANLLLPPGTNDWVVSSESFGLGDWSMPQGMGFWNVNNQQQLDHDNALYAKDKADSEIAQPGTVRVATYSNGAWNSQILDKQQYLIMQKQKAEDLLKNAKPDTSDSSATATTNPQDDGQGDTDSDGTGSLGDLQDLFGQN